MIPQSHYKRMSDDQKNVLNLHIIHELKRLHKLNPEVSREAQKVANTIYTNNPSIKAPRAVTEAYAALCISQTKQHTWLPPELVGRLKTWLNAAGAEIE